MRTKVEVVAELRRMLGDVLAAAEAGVPPERLARAHGYVDGYMRALLDVGLVSRTELREWVGLERVRVAEPRHDVTPSAPREIAAA